MRKNYLAIFAAAATVSLLGFAAAPASALPAAKPSITVKSDVVEARVRGAHRFNHGGFRRHGGWGRHRGFGHRRFSGSRLFIAPYYGYRSYGNGCYWLKRKAINTGSRYWWRRYNACRFG